MLQNECFLFKLCEGKIKDKNLLITKGYDFKDVLTKDNKEYYATIAIKGGEQYNIYN